MALPPGIHGWQSFPLFRLRMCRSTSRGYVPKICLMKIKNCSQCIHTLGTAEMMMRFLLHRTVMLISNSHTVLSQPRVQMSTCCIVSACSDPISESWEVLWSSCCLVASSWHSGGCRTSISPFSCMHIIYHAPTYDSHHLPPHTLYWIIRLLHDSAILTLTGMLLG